MVGCYVADSNRDAWRLASIFHISFDISHWPSSKESADYADCADWVKTKPELLTTRFLPASIIGVIGVICGFVSSSLVFND
jgi:hypothetical protein